MNPGQDHDSTLEEQNPPLIPPRTKARPRKSKFLAGLFSALIPGTGHLYLGFLRKGITFIFIILLDLACMLYFSSIGMQVNVPLLVLLALLIPALYFYNLFDVLQSADRLVGFAGTPKGRRRSIQGWQNIRFGLMLVLGGTAMFLFRQKPEWLQRFIDQQGSLAVSVALMGGGVWLAIREAVKHLLDGRGAAPRIRRVGRYTAAATLASMGVLLLVDARSGSDLLYLMLKWWPAAAVLWGLEYIFISLFVFRKRGRGKKPAAKTRMDLRGLFAALVLSVSVFIVAEQEHYLHLWNKVSLNLSTAAAEYGEAEGSRFDKMPLHVPVELSTAKITIEAINGDILIHRAPVKDVVIGSTVWVDQLDGALAAAVAEQSFVSAEGGATIKITTVNKSYGDSGKRQPRVDLDISVPDNRRFNLQVRTMNGDITLQNVEAIGNIALETGNGELILHRIFGDVEGKTLNGAVRVREVQGGVSLSTSGGNMDAWDVSGALQLTTAVGHISAVRSGDDLSLSTKNGNVNIDGARMKVQAESLNGIIGIRAAEVGGDWDVYSAVGDIDLALPEEGNYKLDGSSSYGDLTTDFPGFSIEKKTISGKAGTGEFKLHIEGNSNINVKKY